MFSLLLFLDCLHISCLLLNWLLADQLRYLDLLVLTNLAWLGSAQLEVLGDLLCDRRLLADCLGHLLIGVTVGVSLCLCLPLVVSIAVSDVNWFLELDLLAVCVLIAGYLGVVLCLGLALLLHLDPAQGLGDGIQLGCALGVVAVIPVVEKVSRGGHTADGVDKK